MTDTATPTDTRLVADLLDPEFYRRNPHEAWTWMRAHEPVYRDERNGLWGITRHADILDVERRSTVFRSGLGYRALWSPTEVNMIAQDDPRHRQQRMLVQPKLTKQSVSSRQDQVHSLTRELLDAATLSGDQMEVVDALAGQLPARLTAQLLGFPESRWRDLKSWSERLMRTDMRDRDGWIFTEFMMANMEFVGVLGEVAAAKMADPGDDLISVWVHASIDGVPYTPEHIANEVGLFIAGGAETTRTAIAHGLRAFADHPEQWDAMATDPSLVPGAVEEVLRWVAPLNNMFRRTLTDDVVGGQPISAGDRLVLLYPAANRDESVFDDPFRFDIRRSPNPHVSFGFGTHLCIGTHVARAALFEVFSQMSARVRDLRVVEEVDVEANIFARAVKSFTLGYTLRDAWRASPPGAVPSAGMGQIDSLAGIIRTHGAGRADHPALIQGDRIVTWSALQQRSERVAQALLADGLGPQDRVAFLDKNGVEHFEVFFGAALLNAVCVDVNWRLAAPEIEYIVNDAEAKVLVVGPDFVPVLDAFAANLTTVERILVIGGAADYESYEDWVESFPSVDPGVESAHDDVGFQLYSSGTTGRPKGVMLTNDNFFSILPLAKDMWELTADAVNLVAMPLFHIGGGGWAVAGMVQGCTSVVIRELDPAALIRTIEERRVTNAFLVPAVLQFMLMVPGAEDADYSSLRVLVYGASPISEEVLARCVEMFKPCRFWQAYGLTETTGSVVNLAPGDHDTKGPNKHRLRSCGLPGPGVEVRIVVDEGRGSDPGEVGEIWIRSGQVMKGYWKQPEETSKAVTADGWFKSGDAGYLDADGYLYIHDRVKDMIVSGGENVYPAEVENVLMSHPAIADVAVIGVPHEKWGETAKAIVVKAADAEVTEAEIIAFAKERLATFKCPTTVEWIDVLPRNPSGKVLKKDLREPYWAGHTRRVS